MIELAVVLAIGAIATTLLMANLRGYDSEEQVRAAVALAVSQVRQAEMSSLALGEPLQVCVSNPGVPTSCPKQSPETNGWDVASMSAGNGSTGEAVIDTHVTPPLHVTGCYRTTFEPNGTVNPAGPCVGDPFLLCVDSGAGTTAFQERVLITPATGRFTVVQGIGACPTL